jgi:transposase
LPPAPDEHEELPAGEDAEIDVQERAFQRPKTPGKGRGRRLVKPEDQQRPSLGAEQRLLILDSWQRSGLPASDFATLVNVSKHTLYAWKKSFAEHGPAGLADQPRGGPKGSRLPELTKRSILMLKQNNPDWGCQRISDMLLRGPALPASASAVARVLHEAGYELEESPTHAHPDKVRHFERAKPNQLWQTDLFTFVLKRQNRRVYLVAFMDDHSRFIVCYGLHASQSSALVLEVLRAGIDAHGVPEEILTDKPAPSADAQRAVELQRHVDELQAHLHSAHIRLELARTMPHVVHTAQGAKKKTPRRKTPYHRRRHRRERA